MPETGSGGRGSGAGPSYFIQINGLPHGYTWKDLKDLIKCGPKASHGIFTWVDGHGSSKGYIKLIIWAEASRTYQYLSEHKIANRRLLVELWDTGRSPPLRMAINYDQTQGYVPMQPLEVDRVARDNSGWIPISSGPPQPAIDSNQQMVSPMMTTQHYFVVQSAPTTAVPLSPTPAQYAQFEALRLQQAYAAQAQAQQRAAQASQWVTGPSGLPVNVGKGAAILESRTVFVGGLSYKAKESDLQNEFKKAGKIVSCKIQRDSSSKKSKGTAQVEYGSTQEAERAINLFHETEFLGRRLIVRLDKDKTTVAPPRAAMTEPVIVHSSMGKDSRSSR